jgi:hypothetical protein
MAAKPIQARLAGTDINDQVNWLQKDGTVYHGSPDPLFSSFTQSSILNPIPKAYEYYEGYPGVGEIRANETETASTGGGFAVGTSVSESGVAFNAPGDRNIMDIKTLVGDFMEARAQGGKTFAIILHGKQYPIPENTESKYVRTYGDGEQFDANFYKSSSWVAFHSRESPEVQTMVDTISVSFRKNFHHGMLKLDSAQVAGISQGTNLVYIRSFGSFNWNNASGLSAGAVVTFNEKTSPVNETLSASGQGTPSIISCSNKTLQFMGVSGNDAVFQNLTQTTPFNGVGVGNQQVSTRINWGNPDYADPAGQPYSIDQQNTYLTLRCRYAASYGTDNILAITIANTSTSKRFFGGSNNIGITAGSYIEVSGASNASNNGIYRVEAVFDGVPGDANYATATLDGDINADGTVNTLDLAALLSNFGAEGFGALELSALLANFGLIGTGATSYKPYQYLRLSRSIIAEEGSSMTIRNVSNLPILHVKYTQVVTPP